MGHPLNPKIHTEAQDAVVEGSLDEVGWLRRVLKNRVTGHILDGHERIELAIRAGEPTVPVDYCEVAAEKEGFVLRVLDQSAALAQPHWGRWAELHRQAEPESGALKAFFAQQAAQGGVEACGEEVGEETGSAAVGGEGENLEGRGAELQAQWGTALGQVWRCGEHWVWCGDSTGGAGWGLVRETVGEVQGCVTSPPYAEQRVRSYGGVAAERYVGWFWPVAVELYGVLAEDGSWFLNLKEHSEGIRRPVYVHELVVRLVREGGWEYLDEFCWERGGIPGDTEQRGKFKNQWEPVFWLAKQVRPVFYPERARHRTAHGLDGHWEMGNAAKLQGRGRLLGGPERRQGGWAYAGNRLPTFGTPELLGHVAAFPVGLPRFFIEVYSDRGDVWVDPFLGSGSTMVACQEVDRVCWGMDQDPCAIALTLERWQAMTGERPHLME